VRLKSLRISGRRTDLRLGCPVYMPPGTMKTLGDFVDALNLNSVEFWGMCL